MNCAVHADREAVGYCRNCGKALCAECRRDVHGALYCETCLGTMVTGTQPVRGPNQPNPRLAAVLGFIPGLGAVYNGEYVKALVQVVIFAGLFSIHNSEMSDMHATSMAFIHLLIVCFYFYMPIDSYRVAKARQLGQPVPENPLAVPTDPAGTVAAAGAEPGVVTTVAQPSKPIWPVILILLGVLFLLANFGLLNEDWFGKAWPMGLILLGGWMVWDRMRPRSS